MIISNSTQNKRTKSVYGFRTLSLALILTATANILTFVVCHLYIEKEINAIGVTLIMEFIFLFTCLQLAWHRDTSMVWQYAVSQLAVSGTVFALMASIYISLLFVSGVIIYGLMAYVMFYFNLADKDLRPLHRSYVPIHIIAAAVAFFLSYFKYN